MIKTETEEIIINGLKTNNKDAMKFKKQVAYGTMRVGIAIGISFVLFGVYKIIGFNIIGAIFSGMILAVFSIFHEYFNIKTDATLICVESKDGGIYIPETKHIYMRT